MNIEVTKDSGEIVSRKYLRSRVSSALSRRRREYSLEERRAVIAKTIDDDLWLARKHGQTVSSIIREVDMEL
jgi:hypothetical protein